MEKTAFNGTPPVVEISPFQRAVNELGSALMRQAQARNGQIDVIWLQLNVLILGERVAILTEAQANGVRVAPADIDLALIERLTVIAADIDQISQGVLVSQAVQKAINH